MAENFFASSSFSSASASASNPSPYAWEGRHHSIPADRHISTMSDIQPKPRFKWTPDLHRRFCEAVQFLGGVQCATPKAIFELMNERDLTLKQVRSHLQIHCSRCFDLEQLARETQAAVAQLEWAAPLPYLYGYPPLYRSPPPALYSPLLPQLPSLPPQQLVPPPPPARLYIDPVGPMPPPSMRVMDYYSAPAPKTIIFKKLFPKGRPVPIDAEETPNLMMSGDVNPGPSCSAARNDDQDDGPLDLTLSIRPPSLR